VLTTASYAAALTQGRSAGHYPRIYDLLPQAPSCTRACALSWCCRCAVSGPFRDHTDDHWQVYVPITAAGGVDLWCRWTGNESALTCESSRASVRVRCAPLFKSLGHVFTQVLPDDLGSHWNVGNIRSPTVLRFLDLFGSNPWPPD
jgi:hypothetical protein